MAAQTKDRPRTRRIWQLFCERNHACISWLRRRAMDMHASQNFPQASAKKKRDGTGVQARTSVKWDSTIPMVLPSLSFFSEGIWKMCPATAGQRCVDSDTSTREQNSNVSSWKCALTIHFVRAQGQEQSWVQRWPSRAHLDSYDRSLHPFNYPPSHHVMFSQTSSGGLSSESRSERWRHVWKWVYKDASICGLSLAFQPSKVACDYTALTGAWLNFHVRLVLKTHRFKLSLK